MTAIYLFYGKQQIKSLNDLYLRHFYVDIMTK